jgi:coproporphyrinogen III oxidase-like Fe-S oxidoreductase
MLAALRLTEDGMVTCDGQTVRLTARGQLLSNDVFQEFLGLEEKAVEIVSMMQR